MSWPQTGDIWWGRVTETDLATQTVTTHDPKWPEVPPIGTEVEIRVIRRSPYWALVEDE